MDQARIQPQADLAIGMMDNITSAGLGNSVQHKTAEVSRTLVNPGIPDAEKVKFLSESAFAKSVAAQWLKNKDILVALKFGDAKPEFDGVTFESFEAAVGMMQGSGIMVKHLILEETISFYRTHYEAATGAKASSTATGVDALDGVVTAATSARNANEDCRQSPTATREDQQSRRGC